MAGVLSESVANKVLPLEGLMDEDVELDGPFIFPPPDGANLLDELNLDKETFFLLIGALTQSNAIDANMALGVLCRDHLDKKSLETLCVRLFSALKEVDAEKAAIERRGSARALRSARASHADLAEGSFNSARREKPRLSYRTSYSDRDADRERKQSVWDRLSRPLGHTPRDSELSKKLSEIVSSLPAPTSDQEDFTPKKPLVKSEEEAKEIFDRLYCDAAKWKVRRRVYSELALMAEDTKVAKECTFHPAVRKSKTDAPQDGVVQDVVSRLFEESKKRISRRQQLVAEAPLPPFRPLTSRNADSASAHSAEPPHVRLHKDASKYRAMRSKLKDYELGQCTFKPDTARSQTSGPKITVAEPIWRRSSKKSLKLEDAPELKARAQPRRLMRQKNSRTDEDASSIGGQSYDVGTIELDEQRGKDGQLIDQESEVGSLRFQTPSENQATLLNEEAATVNAVNGEPEAVSAGPQESLSIRAPASPRPLANTQQPSTVEAKSKVPFSTPQPKEITTISGAASQTMVSQVQNVPASVGSLGIAAVALRSCLTQHSTAGSSAHAQQFPAQLGNATSSMLINKSSSEKLEEHSQIPTQRQQSYKLAQPPDQRMLQTGPTATHSFQQRQASTPMVAQWNPTVDVRLAPNSSISMTSFRSRPLLAGTFSR